MLERLFMIFEFFAYVLSTIGAATGIISLFFTALIFRRSSFNLEIISDSRFTFLWCTHPHCEFELSHVVLKWMRIINKSDVPLTIFDFEYADMRAFSNTYKPKDNFLDESLIEYKKQTFSLPKTLNAYESIEGYFVFRGIGPLPKEGTYKLIVSTSRGTRSFWSTLDYSESDI